MMPQPPLSVHKNGGVGAQVDILWQLAALQVVKVQGVHALGHLFLGTLHLGDDLKQSPAQVGIHGQFDLFLGHLFLGTLHLGDDLKQSPAQVGIHARFDLFLGLLSL